MRHKRFNPPSEDLAETKQKLQEALAKITHLEHALKTTRATLEDVLDDTSRP